MYDDQSRSLDIYIYNRIYMFVYATSSCSFFISFIWPAQYIWQVLNSLSFHRFNSVSFKRFVYSYYSFFFSHTRASWCTQIVGGMVIILRFVFFFGKSSLTGIFHPWLVNSMHKKLKPSASSVVAPQTKPLLASWQLG